VFSFCDVLPSLCLLILLTEESYVKLSSVLADKVLAEFDG
jgi:hypothetical protein